MLFRMKSPVVRPLPLKPFVLKTKDGFFLGLGLSPETGSPCAGCAYLWLSQRNVWTEKMELSDLRLRRDLIADLLSENNPHVFYEISSDGSATRLDCLVFPHPDCRCNKSKYVAPPQLSKRTNFALSPIIQIKCARYGTPSGNLWLTHARGQSAISGRFVSGLGVGRDREGARHRAFEEWMKFAAMGDLEQEMERDKGRKSVSLRSQQQHQALSISDRSAFETLGAGTSHEQALLDAFYSLAQYRTLKKYTGLMKNPMLVVGTNNWARNRIPFFLLQQYDLYFLFYPNSTPSWVVGLAALSRLKTDESPLFVFGAHSNILAALDNAIFKLLERARPSEWQKDVNERAPEEARSCSAKLNIWWTNWIYRCPKISLRDILQLENYAQDPELWIQFFRDGQEETWMTEANHNLMPSEIRHLIRLTVLQQEAKASMPRNVRGIGTMASFSSPWAISYPYGNAFRV